LPKYVHDFKDLGKLLEQIQPSSNLTPADDPDEQIQPSSNLPPDETPDEQIQPSSNLPPDPLDAEPGDQTEATKKVRGRNKSTIKLIEAMREIAQKAHPITGRGIGYQLFTGGLIDSMNDMPKVYRDLVHAREDGTIPWAWVIDETRAPESVELWGSSAEMARSFFYRRDLWQTQPKRVEVWSEKGTVRGVVWPVLAELGVTFQVLHGFNSATCMWNVSQIYGDDDRPLIAFYIGDYDCSGMCMSEHDIPKRLKKYKGHHIECKRIALTLEQTQNLPSFPASDKGPKDGKKGDPRYKWFVKNYGDRCWELDAMDPRTLRDVVRAEINALIDPVLWAEQEALQERDRQSIDLHMQFLQQADERERLAAESHLRQWLLFQSLNSATSYTS
jgi:hypothetical protein